MASCLKIMSLLLFSMALVFTSSIPSSSAHGHKRDNDNEKDLRDLCSDTSNSKLCWDIIKSDYDRFDNDYRSVSAFAIDIATRKGNEIKDLLNQNHHDSNDDKLKEKYKSCSKNYHDAVHDLDLAKNRLDSNDYSRIPENVEDALNELKKCRHDFDKDSFDPGHIRDRNDEFLVYVEIVKIASNRWVKEDHHD